jgi:predicted exporter
VARNGLAGLYGAVSRRRSAVFAGAGILLALSAAGLVFVKYDSSVELMVPRDEAIARNIAFLRTSSLAGKVVISLADGRKEPDRPALLAAADRVARGLDPRFFTEASTGVSEKEMGAGMDAALSAVPALATAEDLAALDAKINPEEVSRRLSEVRRQLLSPSGLFLDSMFRSDPLNLKLAVLNRLRSLSESHGYRVDLVDGHFLSRDGRHAMVVAETPVNVVDTVKSREMLAHLDSVLADLPPGITGTAIGGHIHSVENETLMKRDVRLTLVIATIATAGFIALIGDLGAVIVFVVPLLAALVALDVTWLVLGRLSYAVVGMTALIGGVSVDYGILVYYSLRAAGKTSAAAVMGAITRPVIGGALTTVAVFVPFFLSRIPGYHQLGLFAATSIVLATGCAIFILPHVLRSRSVRRAAVWPSVLDRMEGRRLSNRWTVAAWALLTVAFLWSARNVGFDASLDTLDGVSSRVRQAEAGFRATWGARDLAVLAVTAPTRDGALAANEAVYRDAVAVTGEGNLASLAILLPSAGTVRANQTRWKAFWKDGRAAKLAGLLREEGAKQGFTEDAFEPFFRTLYDVPVDWEDRLAGITRNFLRRTPDGWQVLSFFPDRLNYLAPMAEVCRKHPGTQVVSRNAFGKAVSGLVTSEMRTMTVVAGAFVLVVMLVAAGSIRGCAVSLVPVVTGVVWLLGLLPLLGLRLNIANLIAILAVLGLTGDYGIFMWFRSRAGSAAGTTQAVALCAATTLAGAGTLLFARHPALFSIGVTLVIGIAAGYLSAVFVVPWLSVGDKNRIAGPAKLAKAASPAVAGRGGRR